MVEVLKQGLQSSIQDLGRLGYGHLGVPASGAMDASSALLSNTILGNKPNAAVIEMTLIGMHLKFLAETVICISGAEMSATLNGKAIQLNKKIEIQASDLLTFGSAKLGCRTYLAVLGGFKTDKVLSSRSFYHSITLNSVLKKGDVIKYSPSSSHFTEDYAKLKPNHFEASVLKVYRGPEFNMLHQQQQDWLFNQHFTVSKLNNRMAYQLNETLENSLSPIITSAVLPGTVQWTPNGHLIILMRDAQTTGGYPRILQLSESAINLLSQKKVKDVVQFEGLD